MKPEEARIHRGEVRAETTEAQRRAWETGGIDHETEVVQAVLVAVSKRSDEGIEFGPENHRRLLRMLGDVERAWDAGYAAGTRTAAEIYKDGGHP